MSFLNSVLSSLNDGTTPISVPKVNPQRPASTPAAASPPTPKRKADEAGRQTARAVKPTTASNAADKSRPAAAPGSAKALAAQASAAKAPKKGSFAEILARGQQMQTKPVGMITHKPKERLSAKKEMAMQKELSRKNKKGGIQKLPQTGRNGKPLPVASKADPRAAAKPAKPANAYQGTGRPKPSGGYQGTAKTAAPPAYKGTSKPVSDSRPSYKSESKKYQSSRYDRYSSDEMDEDEDDGYHYASEDYSDMDAGFDDMEEEDLMAERVAKKEDAKEQKLLEELKRLKEAKKKKAMQGR